MKLTSAQRVALTTIADGGCQYVQGRYSYNWDRVAVPDGRRGISTQTLDRLRAAGLTTYGGHTQGSWSIAYDLCVTPRGADLLAGKLRPPVRATATIHVDSACVHSMPVEVDPYQLDEWDARGERDHHLARLAERIEREHMTVTVHIEEPTP